MLQSKNAGQALIDIIVLPANAFAALRKHTSWAWLAIAVLVLSHLIGIYSFMEPMSLDWIVQEQLALARLPPAQAADASLLLMQIAPHAAVVSAVSGSITMIMVAALLGLSYFLGERAFTLGRNSYGGWFSVALWSMLPLALNALGLAILSLMASDPNQPFSLMYYASLNSIILGLPPGHSKVMWAQSISLFHLWNVALATISFRVWSETSWPKAALLAALPYVLVFGLWGALT